jgi:antitoxin component HigA of HigAB toxin-antitoxin module
MNLNEAIEKLSGLVSKFNAEPTTEQTFIDAKLVDGTIIRYEKLEVGQPLFVIDEAGNELKAPTDTHTLEDGTKVRVEEGIIVEIETKEEEAPEEEEMPIEQPMATVESVSKEDFEALKLEVENLRTVFDQFTTSNELLAKNNIELKAIVKETFSIVEKLAKVPTDNPISVRSNNPFKKSISREDELEQIINKFKK